MRRALLRLALRVNGLSPDYVSDWNDACAFGAAVREVLLGR